MNNESFFRIAAAQHVGYIKSVVQARAQRLKNNMPTLRDQVRHLANYCGAYLVGSSVLGCYKFGYGASLRNGIRAFARPWINHIKGVRTSVDAGNHLLTRPFPGRIGIRIANVRDMLMRALGVGLRNTFDFAICHLRLLLDSTRVFFDHGSLPELPLSRSEIFA